MAGAREEQSARAAELQRESCPGEAVIGLQTGRRVGGLRGEPKMNGVEMGANRHRMESGVR